MREPFSTPSGGLRPMSPLERMQIFGQGFEYDLVPTMAMPEGIRIRPPWVAANVVWIHVPQLSVCQVSTLVACHRLVVKQLLGLWEAWEKAGELKYVRSYGGCWVARCVRGSTTVLSNHALGTAFDINTHLLPQGCATPDWMRPLIATAAQHGFVNGEQFDRPDPMHFEVATLL